MDHMYIKGTGKIAEGAVNMDEEESSKNNENIEENCSVYSYDEV